MDDERKESARNLQYSTIDARNVNKSDDRSSAAATRAESDEIKMVDGDSDSIEMSEICSFSKEKIVDRQPTSSDGESPSTLDVDDRVDRTAEFSRSNVDFSVDIDRSKMDDSVDRSKIPIDLSNRSFEDCMRSGMDNEDDVELLVSPRPTKSQVLHYFSRALKFNVFRVDRDFQITDSDGFPLFDAYIDVDCAGRFWTIESYSKPVLFMREYSTASTRSQIRVRDWNGDFFGELSPGEPFFIYGPGKKLLAKLLRHGSSSNGHESTEESALVSSTKSSTSWICVQEETERHLVRLDDYQSLQFNKDVALQLKLLCLAALIRLIGQRGSEPAANCVGIVKTVLNCCAGF